MLFANGALLLLTDRYDFAPRRPLPPTRPVPWLRGSRGRTPAAFRLPAVPSRAARGVRRRVRRARRARGHAHRLRQVALLPAPCPPARRPDDRGLAARRADAGPG